MWILDPEGDCKTGFINGICMRRNSTMCYWVKFREDEKVLREVPVHADTDSEAKYMFQHDFPGVDQFELISP
jgi:hypothetical protein